MVAHSRYNAGGDESNVLKNKLNIEDPNQLGRAESILLSDTDKHFSELLEQHQLQIELALLFDIHQYFLGTLYTWAGKFRTVEISKNGMMFCSSNYLAQSMKDFEKVFKQNIPIEKDSKSIVSSKLAVIHCELNAIHPFREGNGRTIRLFLDLIAGSIGYQPIDWSKSTQKEYMNACVKGMQQNYTPMQKVIYKGLKK